MLEIGKIRHDTAAALRSRLAAEIPLAYTAHHERGYPARDIPRTCARQIHVSRSPRIRASSKHGYVITTSAGNGRSDFQTISYASFSAFFHRRDIVPPPLTPRTFVASHITFTKKAFSVHLTTFSLYSSGVREECLD